MNKYLFKTICFLMVAFGLILGEVVNKSTYGVPLTIFCVITLVVLSVDPFLKYRKEIKGK